MTRPARIVATVVAASLAGVAAPELWDSLPPGDRSLVEALHGHLRAGRSREEAARAIVAARASLARPATPGADERAGAMTYARWLRALDGPERARVVRSLDAATAAAVSASLPDAAPFDAPLAAAVGYAVALGARTLGRLPSARDLAALLALAGALEDVRDDGIVRWERSLRVVGKQEALAALAERVA